MRQVGVWRVGGDIPQRVLASQVDLEKHLENWIERDPGLLETGLRIVGRQVRTEGGPLDLLAVDPQGRWVVIELKRGTIYRDTLTQAMDYAACIHAMPEENLREIAAGYLRSETGSGKPGLDIDALLEEQGEREVRVCVVGTSRDPGLDRLSRFFSGQYGIPITAVTFEVYQLADGDRILVRQLAESETAVIERVDNKPRPIEDLTAVADSSGIGAQFRSLVNAAQRNGLYVRTWKKSFMAAPPENRTRSLFTVWNSPSSSGEAYLWIGTEVFTQFYPSLTEADVTAELGEGEYQQMSQERVAEFVAGLDRLFARLRSLKQAESTDGI